jgi:hypothetical protein
VEQPFALLAAARRNVVRLHVDRFSSHEDDADRERV